MENKYYTPEIEEFHVGFEYEVWDTIGDGHYDWFNDTYFKLNMTNHKGNGGNNVWTIETLAEAISKEEVRVKHLDREDIESLGFEFQGGSDYYWLRYNNGEYMLSQATEVSGEGLDFNLTIEKGGDFYFQGTIKNKSELKRILKQIGI